VKLLCQQTTTDWTGDVLGHFQRSSGLGIETGQQICQSNALMRTSEIQCNP